MFTLFFQNYDPASFLADQNLIRFKAHDWVWVLKFGKFYFPNLGDDGTRFKDILPALGDKKVLFVGTGADFPKEVPKLLTVDFLDGTRAFEIIEVNEKK